jgi:hypothetical protein
MSVKRVGVSSVFMNSMVVFYRVFCVPIPRNGIRELLTV